MPGYESLAKKTDQSHLDDVNEGSKLKKKTNKKKTNNSNITPKIN